MFMNAPRFTKSANIFFCERFSIYYNTGMRNCRCQYEINLTVRLITSGV